MIVDLFSGVGGWSVGARGLVEGVRGIELEPNAAQTHRQAHGNGSVLEADARFTSPHRLRGDAWVEGLVASPPVTLFSRAGRGSALPLMQQLGQALTLMSGGLALPDAIVRTKLAKADERALISLEPLRWIEYLDRDGAKLAWVVIEHAPLAKPLMQIYEQVLRGKGFATWCGVLDTSDFGLAQSRERVLTLGSRLRAVGRPHVGAAKVAMSDVLDLSHLPAGAVLKPGSWTGSARGRSFHRLDQRAPTLAFGNDASGWQWVVPGTSFTETVTVQQMAVLQGFDAKYPFAGARRSVTAQIAAAIPPPVARAALGAVI